MNYRQSIQYINSIPKYLNGRKDIENTRRLMKELGNPEKDLNVIHVAGTNGKGSVCAFSATILVEAGYNIGLFTSPHLEKYNERIQLNLNPINDDDFLRYFNIVRDKCIKLTEKGYTHPTFFEFIFAMSIICFKEKKVSYVILETGLGGRLDATNIIEKPIASVITSIGFDHTEILGNTLEKIAEEKAGIIKKNCPVFLNCKNKKVYEVICRISEEKNSATYHLGKITHKVININDKTIDFSLNTRYYKYDMVKMSMIGHYQIQNIAITLALFKILRIFNMINDKVLLEGIRKTKWPGRMELISNKYLLDGAHNIEGIQYFIKSISHYFSNRPLVLVFGCVKDKPYNKMIKRLCRDLQFEDIILTEISNNRTVMAESLYDVFSQYYRTNIYIEKDIKKAISLGQSLLKKDGLICCIGSLYLIGDIRNILREENYID